MDLTRFLRVRTESPAQGADSGETNSRRTRQYMYKANPLLEKGRTSRAVSKDLTRKDKRHNQLVSRRGISPSNIDSDDEEDVNEDKDKAPKKTTTLHREPLAERPIRSNAAAERMKRLLEYQQKRKQRQAEETKHKRPPFKVGTYKLDTKMTPLKAGGCHLNATRQSIHNAEKSLFKFTATSSSKHNLPSTAILERKTPGTSAPMIVKPGAKAVSSAVSKGNSKKTTKDNKAIKDPVQEKVQEHVPVSHEEPLDLQSTITDSENKTSAMSKELLVEKMDVECKSPEQTTKESTLLTEEPAPTFSSSLPQISHPEDSSKIIEEKMEVTTVHNNQLVHESKQEVAEFKTPGPATPLSRIRGRSVQRTRQHETSLLKEVLRLDFCTERGSSTDRKRRQLGLPPSKTQAEILGLEDIFKAIDSGSPMSVLLEKSKSISEDEDIMTNPKPKTLDAVFDEIANAKESQDDEGAEEDTKKDVQYFRQALKKETDFLENQCVKWNNKIDESTMSEDTLGQIRTAVGLARLGMDRKGRFKQFEGLIDDCEFQRGERKTTCQDLQGFWDMISVQIEDAKTKFLDLEKLEANGWVMPQKEMKVAKKRAAVPANKPKVPAAKSGIRAMIEARRKAMAGKSESPADENKDITPSQLASTSSSSENVLERKLNGSFMGFNTPDKFDALAKRKSILHSGCTSKTNSPLANNLRGVTPNTPSSVKIGKPANKRLSELIMFSTRRLRTSDYFGEDKQSPEVKKAEESVKTKEDVISKPQENIQVEEVSEQTSTAALNQVAPSTPQVGPAAETPKSVRGRRSMALRSTPFESHNSELQLSSRSLRTRKSSASCHLGCDDGQPEKVSRRKSLGFKLAKMEEDETSSSDTDKSADHKTKTPSRSEDDLMDIDQTPLRRTRKSVMFKTSEGSPLTSEKKQDKRRKSLAVETTSVASEPLMTPSKRNRRSNVHEPLASNDTPSQSRRGRKSIAPEKASEVISITPRRMRHQIENSPLRVTFEEVTIDTPNKEKPKRGRPSHVLPPSENHSIPEPPSRSRRSMRASMISDLISFESPEVPRAGLQEPTPQRVTRKSIASKNFLD